MDKKGLVLSFLAIVAIVISASTMCATIYTKNPSLLDPQVIVKAIEKNLWIVVLLVIYIAVLIKK